MNSRIGQGGEDQFNVPRVLKDITPPAQQFLYIMTNWECEENTAILFQNKNVYLLDIPHSIALAQGNPAPQPPESKLGSTDSRKKQLLLSCSPLKSPYPSTEPKKPAARAHVLETVPLSERRFHSEVILPLVTESLETLRAAVISDHWCFTRAVPEDRNDVSSQGQVPRKRRNEDSTPLQPIYPDHIFLYTEPPVILSPSSPNQFRSLTELNVVKNPSPKSAIISIENHDSDEAAPSYEFMIPPQSSFVLCTLPLFEAEVERSSSLNYPIPGLSPDQKFNLILMDPPWPNRSVRRSGHYQTHHYSEMDVLTNGLRDILRAHAYDAETARQESCPTETQSEQIIAAIWITNAEKSRKAAYQALCMAGFGICEEWIWVKTTIDGQPISALDGIWRKPYEILVIGRRDRDSFIVKEVELSSWGNGLTSISDAVATRRVIAAVPDLHSRKPNLKSIFEQVFFTPDRAQTYTALEVFARNLTAGWWAAGNEVLRFNARDCWVDPEEKGHGDWVLA